MMRAFAISLAVGFAAFACAAPASGQVRVEKDIKYVPDSSYADNKDRLDVYVPAHAQAAPVIISVHGGALTEGDKSEQTFVGQRFASAGIVTVVVNYRLSPGVMHPAHVNDLATAAAWVKHNIARYGGDPNKVFLVGHSAGGYLVTLLMLNVRYLAEHQLAPDDFRGAVPVSGFFYVERPGVAPDRPKDIWGADPKAWKAASPASYVRGHLPPILLLYAVGDDAWRRDQQTDFAASLRAAGDTDVAVHMIAGRNHYTVWDTMKNGDEETSRQILQFIDGVLKRSARPAPRRKRP
jgi:acetyl esterase/lipase